MADPAVSKSNPKNRSWTLRSSLIIFVIMMIVGGTVIAAIHFQVHQILLEQLRIKGAVQVDRFAKQAAEALVTMDRLMMTEIINSVIKQEKSILTAALVDHDGRIIVHSQSDLEGTLYRSRHAFLYVENETMQIARCFLKNIECLDFSKKITLDQRIKDKAMTLGYAHIVFSIDSVKKNLMPSVLKSILIVLAGGALTFMLSWLLLTAIDRKITRFNHLLERVAEGHWHEKATDNEQKKNEAVPELMEHFNQMKNNLETTLMKRLEAVKKEQRERLAKTIQGQLVPKTVPNISGYDIGMLFRSGKIIRGDYLDFIRIDDHHWGMVVADIAGQGVTATVAMSQVRSFLRSATQYHVSPLKTLVTTNWQLYKDKQESCLVTMIYAVLDQTKSIVNFIRAGHVAALIYRRASKEIEYEKPAGIAMGIAPPETFELMLVERKIKLFSGDCLMLYTDGIEKVFDKMGVFYKSERLRDIFNNYIQRSAKTIVKVIENDIKQNVGNDWQDDIAIILLKVEEGATS